MKAIIMSEFGGPEVLKYGEKSTPVPGPGEVCVRLYAAGVNPNEAYIRTGTYAFYMPALPYTPGFDGSGIVEALGEDVHHLKIGDRVFVAALLASKNTGTYAQRVVCDKDSVHLLPESLSYQQGAALGIPALSAYRALVQRAQIKPGQCVLIHGASGGVGQLAVQIAKAMGTKVIGTASSEQGKALVKACGADLVFDHISQNNLSEVISLTDGKGPDVIIEFLANVNLEIDLKLIAKYGRIVVVGNRGSIEITPRLAMAKEADILGMAIFNATSEEYSKSLQGIKALLESGMLKPQIGQVLPLEKAKESHEVIMSQKARGKIILSID